MNEKKLQKIAAMMQLLKGLENPQEGEAQRMMALEELRGQREETAAQRAFNNGLELEKVRNANNISLADQEAKRVAAAARLKQEQQAKQQADDDISKLISGRPEIPFSQQVELIKRGRDGGLAAISQDLTDADIAKRRAAFIQELGPRYKDQNLKKIREAIAAYDGGLTSPVEKAAWNGLPWETWNQSLPGEDVDTRTAGEKGAATRQAIADLTKGAGGAIYNFGTGVTDFLESLFGPTKPQRPVDYTKIALGH